MGLSFEALKAAETANPPAYNQQGMLTNADTLTAAYNSALPVGWNTNPYVGPAAIAPSLQAEAAAYTASHPNTIKAGEISSVNPFPVITPNVDPNAGGPLVAGASQTTNSLQSYIDQLTPPETDEQKKSKELTSRISELLPSLEGRKAALIREENAQGVETKKNELANLNSQIKSGVAEYEQMKSDIAKQESNIQAQKIPMGFITGQLAQSQRQNAVQLQSKASEIGLLQARALGKQGEIDTAKEVASRAIDLKYAAVEDEITTKTKQLELLQPTLSKQEKVQAEALSRQYADQQKAVAEQKAQAKTNIGLALDSGITSRYANAGGEIFDTRTGLAYPTPEAFYKAAGVSSFEDAYAKGLIQDVKNNNLTFSIQDVGGRTVRFGFDATGKKVSQVDLGSTKSPSTSSGEKNTLNDDVVSMKSQLDSVVGTDGRVSPESWKKAQKAWQDEGRSAASFVTNFKNYQNPLTPDEYK